MTNIYYFGYHVPKTGGDFVNIEHVTALQAMGFNACLIYPFSDASSVGFTKNVETMEAVRFHNDDYFVIPENDPRIFQIAFNLPARISIHNQNTYHLFNAIEHIGAINTHRFNSMISPSKTNAQLVLDAGYTGKIEVITPEIPDYFARESKKIFIAYSPRKLPRESRAVITMFRSLFPRYAGIPWRPLINMGRKEVATILGKAAIYAAFSHLESLSLSVLEAMASGCIVVGDHGGGGGDYANDTNGLWVEAHEIKKFAESIARAVRLYEHEGDCNSMSSMAMASASKYNKSNFEAKLKDYWMRRQP